MESVDWTGGYVADISYTFGYYPELNPLRARIPLLVQNVRPPTVRTACELGFGQGISVAVHSAASQVEWWGTDFNPSQASFAQGLVSASDTAAKLFDESFLDFANRGDLPEFDFIGLHGIWSWVSDANRDVLIDIVRRKLRPGGVLYVSYNVLSAWSGFIPMRNLLVQHGAGGRGTLDRVARALEFADRLVELEPNYARANPQVAERLKRLRDQDRKYVAHEYFNRDWRPMDFSEIASLLAPAKVTYAGSAHMLDHVEELNLRPAQRALVGELDDPILREMVRDLMVNQQFRRDYWVKGPNRLSALEQVEALGRERIIMTSARPNVPIKVNGMLGEASLNENVYAPVLEGLDGGLPSAIGDLADNCRSKGLSLQQVLEAVLVLSAGGHVTVAQDDSVADAAKPIAERLNQVLMERARSHGDIGVLASPVTGGGVSVGRFEQLFLAAVLRGAKTPSEFARSAWEILQAQGQQIVKDGVPLTSAADNLTELQSQAVAFDEKTLPVVKTLGLC